MSYQVLARKYRPQRFRDVIGQQHATVTLMNALNTGRIAHGYIFSGHRGIGKTTVARILAMALNCRRPIGAPERPDAEPCGTCESCVEVRNGNSVDVIEIDAATNRGIDEIRELRDAARYRPARDRYKIYILDEAHQITDAAFNALLKTLEEPPEHIVFMMATTQPEDIPQTVRSRCQHFSFRAVRFTELVRELRSIAEREEIEASEAVLQVVAEAGDGSVRDALSVLDQAIASAPTESDGHAVLDLTLLQEMLGVLSGSVFARMLDAVRDGRAADLITTANELIDLGNSPLQIARQFVRYLRSSLLAKIAKVDAEADESSDLLQISVEEQKRAARTAAAFSEEDLTRFLQIMLRTFDELGYRQEPRLHLELGLMKLMQLRRLLPLEHLLSQLPSEKQPAMSPPRVSSPLPAALRAAPADLSKPAPRAAVPLAAPREAIKDRESSAVETTDEPASAPEANLPIAAEPPMAAAKLEMPEPPPPSRRAPELNTQGSSAEDLQSSVVAALMAARGQTSAADALADAEWQLAPDGSVRAQTALSPRMLAVIVSAEVQAIIRRTLAQKGMPDARFEALPASEGAEVKASSSKRRPPRAGSAESRAQQHPVVQEAQRLFNAEIRNVIDLSNAK